jgi:hypothetical protein
MGHLLIGMRREPVNRFAYGAKDAVQAVRLLFVPAEPAADVMLSQQAVKRWVEPAESWMFSMTSRALSIQVASAVKCRTS